MPSSSDEVSIILEKIISLKKVSTREMKLVDDAYCEGVQAFRNHISRLGDAAQMSADLDEAQAALEARQLEQAYCLHEVISASPKKKERVQRQLNRLLSSQVAFKVAMIVFYRDKSDQLHKDRDLAMTAEFLATLDELDRRLGQLQGGQQVVG